MLFKTYAAGNVSVPMEEENEKYWSYIELSVNHSLFLVKLLITEGEESCFSTFFLTWPEQFLQLQARADTKIHEVHLITPPHLNKEEIWRMQLISKIHKASQKYKGSEEQIFKYEFDNGSFIVDSKFVGKVSKSLQFETLFSFDN